MDMPMSELLSHVLRHLGALVAFDTRNPPRLIGTSALQLKDINGKEFVRDMLAIVKNKDQGEIDYAWRNAVTGKVDKKHSYLRKVGNVVVGVGYYAN